MPQMRLPPRQPTRIEAVAGVRQLRRTKNQLSAGALQFGYGSWTIAHILFLEVQRNLTYSPLWSVPNLIVTPHTSWSTGSARS